MSESSQNTTFGTGSTFGSDEPVRTTTSVFGSKPTSSFLGQQQTTQAFGSDEPVRTTSSVFQSKPTSSFLGQQQITQAFGSDKPVRTTTSMFGSKPTSSFLGQQQTTQAFGSGLSFGSTSSLFGGFGSKHTPGPFGQESTTQAFGSGLSIKSTSSLFGGFGSKPTPGPFGQESTTQEKSSNSGTDVKFVVVKGTDSIIKNGITINMSVRYQCITFMSTYNRKSLESSPDHQRKFSLVTSVQELRIEDYYNTGRACIPAEAEEDSREEPSEFEKALEKRKKYICPEHDEVLKVFCHTDNCLICLVCQVYGEHTDHKCELVANMATGAREELFSETKKLEDHFELIKKSRRKLKDKKDSILQTQLYLRDRVAKHMALLRTCLDSGERALKSEIDDKTNEKIAPMDAQDRVMANVEEKCDLAYSLIEKCKKNDSALVEEKPNIFKLIEEVSSSIQKCELESAETDSLTCYFEYKLFDMLKTQIGGVRMLKPGKKEGSIYGFNEHEMLEEGKTKDAEVQTDADDHQERTDHAHSEISPQGLDLAVDFGAVGSKTSLLMDPDLPISTDSQSSSDVITGLLDEILEKVDRLAVADGDDDSAGDKQKIETDD